jgi:hypothetical protein
MIAMRPSLRVFAPNDAADFEPSDYKPKPRLVEEYCGGEWVPHCRARAARRQALTLFLAILGALVLLAAAATRSFGGVEVDAGGRTIRKPDLYVYVSPTNEQCQAFEADLEGDRDFNDALRAKYSVHIYDYDRFRFNAAIAGVKSLPAFFAPGQRWEGYRGKVDVAERLKLRWAPPVQVPPVVDPPPPQRPLAVEPQQLQVPPAAALEAIYDRWTRHERRLSSIDEFVARMAVRIRNIEEQNPEAIDELRAEVKKLLQSQPKAKDLESLRSEVKLRIEQVAGEGAADVAAEKAKEVAHAAFEEFKEQVLAHGGQEGPHEIDWMAILQIATTALGWTGPPSIAVYAIGRALIFLFKHRGAVLPDPEAPPPAADGTIAASAPAVDGVAALRSDLARYAGLILNRQQAAPPTQVFTPVETQLYAEAVSWAKDQLVRRYPGAQGNIEQLNSLIEQFLSQPQAKA